MPLFQSCSYSALFVNETHMSLVSFNACTSFVAPQAVNLQPLEHRIDVLIQLDFRIEIRRLDRNRSGPQRRAIAERVSDRSKRLIIVGTACEDPLRQADWRLRTSERLGPSSIDSPNGYKAWVAWQNVVQPLVALFHFAGNRPGQNLRDIRQKLFPERTIENEP